jgi:hypothetical protein
MFYIGAIDEGDFYVKFYLCNKEDSFKWALVTVYSPAQDDQKSCFLTELVNMFSREALPILIGGDFNILRSPDDKNKDNYTDRWPFLFNALIDGLNLRELEMSGRKYKWANSLENPTYEKLDLSVDGNRMGTEVPIIHSSRPHKGYFKSYSSIIRHWPIIFL